MKALLKYMKKFGKKTPAGGKADGSQKLLESGGFSGGAKDFLDGSKKLDKKRVGAAAAIAAALGATGYAAMGDDDDEDKKNKKKRSYMKDEE